MSVPTALPPEVTHRLPDYRAEDVPAPDVGLGKVPIGAGIAGICALHDVMHRKWALLGEGRGARLRGSARHGRV